MAAPDLFNEDDRKRVKSAIENAESLTSGELRVYIEDECKGNVLDRAALVFDKLGMADTAERNGVLIYLAVSHNKFAIIGDAGIHEKVGDHFWNKTSEEMKVFFKAGKYTDGLVHGVNEAGQKLKAYFPHKIDDTNELSDDIIFGA